MDIEKGLVTMCGGSSSVVFADIEYRIKSKLTDRICRKLNRNSQNNEETQDRLILKGVCGTLKPSRLTFILGPSGAGKSTLLHILAGRKKVGVSGFIQGTGEGLVLVSQNAALLNDLTAGETLSFAASLKLPNKTKKDKWKTIDKVTKLLGIEEITKTKNSDISGGERKRLSIACEILTQPTVLLLDEPTSGLDSVSSIYVVKALLEVAASGVTVGCVIHQPSSRIYALCDDVILIGSGCTLYSGPRTKVNDTFKEANLICPPYYNPADFMLEVASMEIDGVDKNYLERESRMYAYELITDRNKCCFKNVKRKSHSYESGFLYQVGILLKRGAYCSRRDLHLTQLRLAAHVIVALLLGALYSGSGADAARVQTNTSCLFFFIMFLFFSNAMPTIQSFPAESEIVIQEHLNYWYSLPAYCIAKIITDLPIQVMCATVFAGPAWFLTDQPSDYWRLGLMWLMCLLLTILAQTFGLVIGAACDVKLGLFIVPASNIPMLMFSGFFIRYQEMPSYLKPLASISYFQYAFDAAIDVVYGFNRGKLPCSEPFCMYRNPEKYISSLSISNDYWLDIKALGIWIILLQICLILVLITRIKIACR